MSVFFLVVMKKKINSKSKSSHLYIKPKRYILLLIFFFTMKRCKCRYLKKERKYQLKSNLEIFSWWFTYYNTYILSSEG